MKLKFDLTQFKKQVIQVLSYLHRHSVVALTVFGGILGFIIIMNVQGANDAPRSEAAYIEELAAFKGVRFDEQVIQEIVKLTANDVDIRSDLPENRNNPFLDF